MATLALGHVNIVLPCLRTHMNNCTVPEVHLFQLCRAQGSVPCLKTVQNAHTSQTNWTMGVKCTWARYGLPSVRPKRAAQF